MTRYVFDRDSVSFRKVTTSIGTVLWRVFKWLIASFSLAALYYVIICFFVHTDTERKLLRENRAYEREYAEMASKVQLISDNIEGLRQRDDAIYDEIFHSPAPEVDPVSAATTPYHAEDLDYVKYTAEKTEDLKAKSERIEENFREIFSLIGGKDRAMPPMLMPVGDLTYAQIGAGTGSRISPFYKVEVNHGGLDIIAGQGEAVRATAPGIVKEVIHSGKGLGNTVVIDHGNGYATKYCHLADILVTPGQRVGAGRRIASVGISGNSFAPHLHYEVLLDGERMDPSGYLFASLSPAEYANIAYMANNTRQSLD